MLQSTLTNALPQNKHLCTASRSSSTNQLLRTAVGINSLSPRPENGRKAFLVHPMHVRTCAVERMKVVTEHLAVGFKDKTKQKKKKQFATLDQIYWNTTGHLHHVCPFGQTALMIS